MLPTGLRGKDIHRKPIAVSGPHKNVLEQDRHEEKSGKKIYQLPTKVRGGDKKPKGRELPRAGACWQVDGSLQSRQTAVALGM